MAAADVGDGGARLQLLRRAVQRRDPALDQVGLVAGAEEALRPLEEPMVVLAPGETAPVLNASAIRGSALIAGGETWKPPPT